MNPNDAVTIKDHISGQTGKKSTAKRSTGFSSRGGAKLNVFMKQQLEDALTLALDEKTLDSSCTLPKKII